MTKHFTLIALFCALAGPLSADIYDVSLDTTSLVATPAGPYSLAFGLVDGSGTMDGNNTVTISNFLFGGGTVVTPVTAFGGSSGDLTTTVALTDSFFLNYFQEGFTPGGSLSFVVNSTTNPDAGGVPDEFSFQILDGNGLPIPTTNPDGSNTLLELSIFSTPVVQAFGSDTTTLTSTGATLGVPTPTVVPEPGTATLLALAVAGLCGLRRRQRQ